MISRKRGRPKATRPSFDTGTPELVFKRALGLTGEPLDACLERGLISPQQHWCGIHLRWLYTLRFGAPGVRAVNPLHVPGMETRTDEPGWRGAREQEYTAALQGLGDARAKEMLDLCVHHEWPRFLLPATRFGGGADTRELEGLQEGFTRLERLWVRQKRRAR